MDSASCPLCKSGDSITLFEVQTEQRSFCIVQCRQCNLTRTTPFPDDDMLDTHNKPQYYGRHDSKFIPFFQNIRDRLSKRRARTYLSLIADSIKKPKILDIGCAEGRLLNSFLEYGCDCYGVEHPSYPKQRFINIERIHYFLGNLDDLDLEKNSFNIIILWHVLEHLDHPDEILKQIYDLLASDGIVVVAVPNFSSIEARIFKGAWFHLDIPWHKYHFTEESINYFIKNNNFQVIKKSTFCLEQGVYGVNQSILNFIGWPRNEMYEAIKGSILKGRALNLVAQSIISVFLLLPCVFISLITSMMKKGSVLKIVLKKS